MACLNFHLVKIASAHAVYKHAVYFGSIDGVNVNILAQWDSGAQVAMIAAFMSLLTAHFHAAVYI